MCVICWHYTKVNFRNLLAEASQNFTDPSAWLKRIQKLNLLKQDAILKHLLSVSDKYRQAEYTKAEKNYLVMW